VESDDLIVVGAAGLYEARCRGCFEPGAPRQEVLEFVTVTRRETEPRPQASGLLKAEDGSRNTNSGGQAGV
jgi:hypothetical protein